MNLVTPLCVVASRDACAPEDIAISAKFLYHTSYEATQFSFLHAFYNFS